MLKSLAMKLNLKKLEGIRGRKRMSKTQFSVAIGLKDTTYRKIYDKDGESVTVKTINRMADALHVDPLDLLLF